MMRKSLIALLVFACCTAKAQQSEIREAITSFRDSLQQYDYMLHVFVLQPDGKSALTLGANKTTSFTQLNMLVGDVAKKESLYLFPLPYKEEFIGEDSLWKLTMPRGGFTQISQNDLSPNITVKGDTFFFRTNPKPRSDGHYGHYQTKKAINQFSYAWIFPKEFTPISYKSNRKGNWQTKENIIHFVADGNQNDFLFEIAYVRAHSIPKEIEGRPVKYVQSMDISSDTIQVIINDPQREDGDIISLNVNGEWKMRNFEVSNAQARFSFILPYNENYIALHAENTGAMPPNTAMLTIIDGKVRKQIILNSDTGKTEGILLHKK